MSDGIRLIGDIHAEFDLYMENVKASPYPTVQVGDYGIGFRSNPIITLKDSKNHRFIRGNHDDPELCKAQANWIPDGTIEDGIMFIGGATSIDKAWRTPGLDWWYDEECSVSDLEYFINLYEKEKPNVMVTHECPESIADIMLAQLGRTKYPDPSRTRQALEVMKQIHQPKLHVFGHWHMDFDQVIDGTRYVCLNCHSYIDLVKE
ncbi:metallophosphatase [Ochrobactrum phage vB_OspM_OC]|nr:metallophosphatase [Ochrobactrum phage vB_OspM_OC]